MPALGEATHAECLTLVLLSHLKCNSHGELAKYVNISEILKVKFKHKVTLASQFHLCLVRLQKDNYDQKSMLLNHQLTL